MCNPRESFVDAVNIDLQLFNRFRVSNVRLAYISVSQQRSKSTDVRTESEIKYQRYWRVNFSWIPVCGDFLHAWPSARSVRVEKLTGNERSRAAWNRLSAGFQVSSAGSRVNSREPIECTTHPIEQRSVSLPINYSSDTRRKKVSASEAITGTVGFNRRRRMLE